MEAGCDEAGRGCLAGPVVAAAVILQEGRKLPAGLNDSKQLQPEERAQFSEWIRANAAGYAYGVVDNREIDRLNIFYASIEAINRAVSQLTVSPEFLLIDGKYFYTSSSLPYECIIKGDGKYCSIAAASILAKVYRDNLMEAFHRKYPVYDWKSNKGYPTLKHRKGILEHGASPLHRKTFNLFGKGKQLELNL